MNQKQKTVLIRILLSAACMVLFSMLQTEGYVRFGLFMIPYLIIGYDILKKAGKGIRNRQVFDENFLMTIATFGAIAVGSLEEAVAGPENVKATDTSDTEPSPEAAESGQESSGFFGRMRQKICRLLDKIKAFWEKLKTAFQNIRYTIRHMCDKIKTASDTIQYYREVFLSDAFGRSFALCKEQAGVVLKDLKPDRVEVDLIVGTGDPASTGEVLAVCGMLYPVFGPKVRIEGDFELARLEGCVFIKGKIRAFTFLRVAWKLYRNKDIRTLIKLFKKEAV